MKPYGIIHIGPACAWGCCFREPHRGAAKERRCRKKRARQAARRAITHALQGVPR